MQLNSLKIYCDVVRLRSFSRAAEANKILQATASLAVQRLEKHLGVTLIDRTQRPWRQTKEGEIFSAGCRKILDDYLALEREVSGLQATDDTIVRVAAIYSVNLHDMSQCVQRFNELRSRARIELEYLHPSRVCERVLNDEADLGIISFPESQRGFSIIPWRHEAMVLACPPRHPLAGVRRLRLSQLEGEPFVGFDANLIIRKKIDAFLRMHEVEVKVALTFDNIEAVKRAVEAGSGIAILPLPTLEHELQSGSLAAIPFAGKNFVRPLGIVHRRGWRPHANAQTFIDLLKANTEGDGKPKVSP